MLFLQNVIFLYTRSRLYYKCSRIIEFKICIYSPHFFVNNHCIEHKRHFLSIYFLLDCRKAFIVFVGN